MHVRVTNTQQETWVDTDRMARIARWAARQLKINGHGTLAITFIGSRRMRALNKQFLRHDRLTDVLSFRYDGEPIVGEILIDPSQAKAYATRHNVPYAEELSRYVIHGLLHWLGHRDGTRQEQVVMREQEDTLLARCGVLSDIRHETSDRRPKPRRRSHVSGLRSQV